MNDQPKWPASWLTPDWPAIAGVHAVCTSREGGVSEKPWGSMNLGDHVNDKPEHVRRNRELFSAAIQSQTAGACTAFLQQVHGVDVLALDADNISRSNGASFDACVTADAGVVCTIMVADCLPVLLAHDSGLVVGAAHAGWRGLAGMPPSRVVADGPLLSGVLESLFESFCQQVQSTSALPAIKKEVIQIAAHTQAWLGPCIGPESFEVGAEVRDIFVAHDPSAAQYFVPTSLPNTKYLANLPQLARQRLAALGISAIFGNDGSEPWCTVTNASRFFSHRRDAARLGSSGRLAASIWRDA
ncbi:laccase domain-containing protein [Comamonas sp. Y33R10-2]|uniref:polyphenol oxidase family protein n=1 Tax=Comamonas sp. Y33R10-2 TaxID=2853257 RepID=UPI001C5C8DD3|nr:laccase domain-containing protein [Comamonas sp. Y33R10-2]QXZ11002.1 laccase domain-containing protein [Comamonas sp. Y33R10-2]